uniref:Uncharacterized protein n=1 Tax=Anguilla anguilla TaxID=7936 RepID=A0A0E9S4Q5_ANGAN
MSQISHARRGKEPSACGSAIRVLITKELN